MFRGGNLPEFLFPAHSVRGVYCHHGVTGPGTLIAWLRSVGQGRLLPSCSFSTFCATRALWKDVLCAAHTYRVGGVRLCLLRGCDHDEHLPPGQSSRPSRVLLRGLTAPAIAVRPSGLPLGPWTAVPKVPLGGQCCDDEATCEIYLS